jgi:hypothetical protein
MLARWRTKKIPSERPSLLPGFPGARPSDGFRAPGPTSPKPSERTSDGSPQETCPEWNSWIDLRAGTPLLSTRARFLSTLRRRPKLSETIPPSPKSSPGRGVFTFRPMMVLLVVLILLVLLILLILLMVAPAIGDVR